MGYWQQRLAEVRGTPNKKTVSTKGIFNKHEFDPTRELKPRARKVSKTSKPGKSTHRKPALSTAFSDTVEASREHIAEAGATNFEAAHAGLLQRLKEMSIQHDNKEQALTDSMAKLHLPFKNEQIEFRSEDGKQSGVVNLNHRMKKVQKTIDAEAAELDRQFQEWLAIESEIARFDTDFMVPDASDERNVEVSEETWLAWEKRLVEEVEASRAYSLEMMEQTAKKSIKDMTECEKAFTVGQKKVQDKFSAMLQDEEMWTG